MVGPHIFGVSIGKVDNPQIADEIEGMLSRLESNAGLSPGAIKLIPWIESAEAIVNAYAVCGASERIVAVALGAEDFTNDMEIERRDDDAELAYARSAIAVAARAAGVLALDTPYFAFRDPDGLRANSLESRGVGFRGRFAIHPAQIDVINEVYSPSEDQIEHALRVIEAFEEAVAMGRVRPHWTARWWTCPSSSGRRHCWCRRGRWDWRLRQTRKSEASTVSRWL